MTEIKEKVQKEVRYKVIDSQTSRQSQGGRNSVEVRAAGGEIDLHEFCMQRTVCLSVKKAVQSFI